MGCLPGPNFANANAHRFAPPPRAKAILQHGVRNLPQAVAPIVPQPQRPTKRRVILLVILEADLGPHKYTYVHGDPIGNIDPTGQMSLTTTITAIGIGTVVTAFAAGAATGVQTEAEQNFWWEGFLPGWGSGRAFGANVAEGRWGWAALNATFGVLDTFVVGSMFRNIAARNR